MTAPPRPVTSGSVQSAFSIERLVKSFGRTRALDGLTMAVPAGQVHGFLGPSGAGKSTTIRVLLGLLRPDAGRVRLLGKDPWADAPRLHRRMAYVPGEVSLWPGLTGGEAIDLIGRARGGLDPVRRADLIERFQLDPRKKGRAYTRGNRQKVALIAALASDAELLLLDEPTSGLDPVMARTFADYLRTERASGCTVLLSSQILSEVEALCDHVSIIRAGRIVESGTVAELRHLRRTQLAAELEVPVPAGLSHARGIHEARIDGHRITCQVDANALTAVLARLTVLGVRSLVSSPPTLEELFVQHYAESGPARQSKRRIADVGRGATR